MKRIGDEAQHLGKRCTPVRPIMSPVADTEFMGNILLSHGNMDERVAFIEKIIIPAVNLPADGFFLIVRYVLNERKNTLAPVICFHKAVGNILHGRRSEPLKGFSCVFQF